MENTGNFLSKGGVKQASPALVSLIPVTTPMRPMVQHLSPAANVPHSVASENVVNRLAGVADRMRMDAPPEHPMTLGTCVAGTEMAAAQERLEYVLRIEGQGEGETAAPISEPTPKPGDERRPHMVVASGNYELFSHWGALRLQSADGVCIDMDAASNSGRAKQAVDWIDRALALGKQVFVVGERNLLREDAELQTRDVTLLEKSGILAKLSGEQLAQAVGKDIDAIHARYATLTAEYAGSAHALHSRHAAAEPHAADQGIDSNYLKSTLTDEEYEELIDYMSESE